jgi:hypothetical protein
MRIKLTLPKNVYGVRQPAGKELEVGSQIPEWQADKLREVGGAVEIVAKKKKTPKKTEVKG